MLGETIPQMLETELESQIGYPKGNMDVLGMWVGENEPSKFWLTVINKLKIVGLRISLSCKIIGHIFLLTLSILKRLER